MAPVSSHCGLIDCDTLLLINVACCDGNILNELSSCLFVPQMFKVMKKTVCRTLELYVTKSPSNNMLIKINIYMVKHLIQHQGFHYESNPTLLHFSITQIVWQRRCEHGLALASRGWPGGNSDITRLIV